MVDVIGTSRPVVAPNPAAKTMAPSASDPTKTSGARVSSAPFQIVTMQSREKWLKMLVYGKHGTGKTELVASAVDVPEMNDVLMVDSDKGELTIIDSRRIKNGTKINHIEVTHIKQLGLVHDYLKAHCKHRDENNEEKLYSLQAQVTGYSVEELKQMGPPPRYRTVILDSLTEIDSLSNYSILGLDPAKIMAGDMADIDTAGWPEFRKNNEMIKMLMRAYRDLPIHVLYTAAESWTQDETKKFHYSPAMTGKLSAQVQGFMDIVGYLVTATPEENKDAPRRLYVQPVNTGSRFDAKNRRSAFRGSYFDDPLMADIMKKTALI